jgi:GntR family transcriptional regulator
MISCADPGICRELGIEPHDEVIVRKRVFRVHDKPVVIGVEIIHPRALAVVADLLKQGPRGPVHWFTEYEEQTDKQINGSPEMRAARHASRDELKDLEVPVPDSDVAVPVLELACVTQVTRRRREAGRASSRPTSLLAAVLRRRVRPCTDPLQ